MRTLLIITILAIPTGLLKAQSSGVGPGEKCDTTFFKNEKGGFIDPNGKYTLKAQKETVSSENMCCLYAYRNDELIFKECKNSDAEITHVLHLITWAKDRKTGKFYKAGEYTMKPKDNKVEVCTKIYNLDGSIKEQKCKDVEHK